MHRLDGCDYAIKIWPMLHSDSASELKLIAWLQNNCLKESLAHIVRYHWSWQEERIGYMVLEHCKFSLRKFARLRRFESFEGLTEQDVIRVLRDTCLGLKGLHMLGVVHLDIKPENILCSRDETFKISDFGLARRLCDFLEKGEQEIPEGDERYLA